MAGKWQPVSPVPNDAPEPPRAHLVRGVPEAVFEYHGTAGLIGYVYRFAGSDGTDRDITLSYCVNAEGTALEWRWIAFETPRPLYGPMKLAWQLYPDAAVVVTDDLACVDAGHELIPQLKFCAWLGGVSAIKKTDWSTLAARTVWLWPTVDAPDSDQPNLRAMKQLATILVKQGCTVKLIDTAGGQPGWNLAAAKAAKWDPVDTMAWMTERAKLIFSRTVFSGSDGPGGKPTPRIAGAEQRSTWRDKMFLHLRKGELADCRENVIELLSHHPAWNGVLAWDEFSYRIVKRRPAPYGGEAGLWEDDDFVALGKWLAENEGLLIRSIDTMTRAVLFCAGKNKFHPVRELLQSLEWDGTPRLDKWLPDFLGTEDNEYTNLVGRFFFINLVRRAMEPGCIMRSVVVLIGGQDKGKSTALSIIGGEWFADTMFNVGDKDAYQVLRGKLLYEIAEFQSFGKVEANRVKAFVSSKVDTYRASYGHVAKDWPRQTSFIASTNQYELFRDNTGNTRFHPVTVTDINLDGLSAARLQLLAEAYHRYKAGERAHPTPEQQRELFTPMQDRHTVMDPWHQGIYLFLRQRTSRKVTIDEILVEYVKIERSKLNPAHGEVIRIVGILQALGCKKDREGSGAREWFYHVPDFMAMEREQSGAATGENGADGTNDAFA